MQHYKTLTLHKNVSWTLIGNGVYAACQWGMLVVLAKLGTPEMVGQFALGLAIATPIFALTNLQLRSIQATDIGKQYRFGDYLALRLISSVSALLLIAVMGLLRGYRWETFLVICLVGLAKAFESISDVFSGLIQRRDRSDLTAISLMVKGILSLLLLGIGLHLSGSILWGVTGLSFTWAIVLFSYDLQNALLLLNHKSQIRPRWEQKTFIKLAFISLPLGLVMMLISLNANIPRYFIEEYLGEEQLGIFAAIAYLMVLGGIVVNALGESSIARLAKYYVTKNAIAFRNLLFKLVGIAILLSGTGVGLAIVFGREILSFLYGFAYAEQANLLVWLMVAAGMSYISSFLGYGMIAARQFSIQIPLFAIGIVIAPISCIFLLPKLGLLGAAIALILTATVQAVMSLIVILYTLHSLDMQSKT
jgi:O-antigen/teichoic acid export membrane protein